MTEEKNPAIEYEQLKGEIVELEKKRHNCEVGIIQAIIEYDNFCLSDLREFMACSQKIIDKYILLIEISKKRHELQLPVPEQIAESESEIKRLETELSRFRSGTLQDICRECNDNVFETSITMYERMIGFERLRLQALRQNQRGEVEGKYPDLKAVLKRSEASSRAISIKNRSLIKETEKKIAKHEAELRKLKEKLKRLKSE